MELNFDKLKDWFSAFYQVILGQDQGPRLGSFIKFYGIEKTITLLRDKIKLIGWETLISMSIEFLLNLSSSNSKIQKNLKEINLT